MRSKFFYLIFILLCTFSYADEPDPKEAWVMYATSNYFSLAEVTIASIHTFSTRPVVLVGVNADVPFSSEQYPRLIKKRIDANIALRGPYVYKPQCILLSGVSRGIYIDADAIVNKGCDTLFGFCDLVEQYPLCPTHEKEAYVSPDTTAFFGVKERSMHYVHADLIIFSESCKDFLSNWCDVCLNYYYLGIPCWDETLLNVLLWKIGATQQVTTIDPYNAYIEKYLFLSPAEIAKPPYNHWFLFHGNKDTDRGWRMLFDLRDKHNIFLAP